MSRECIRRAENDDAAAIVELCNEMQRVHRGGHAELFQAEEVVLYDVASIQRMLDDPSAVSFVAQTSLSPRGHARVVGFAHVVEVQTPPDRALAPRRFAMIEDLVVEPGARRAGIASALMDAVEDWARSRGIPALEATVWAFNRPVLELCEKRGARILRHYVRKEL